MTKIKGAKSSSSCLARRSPGSFANFYMWLSGISVTFLGYTVSSGLLGVKAVVPFVLFVVFLYFGWLRK